MKLIKTLLLAAALATSGLALAHTDKPHDKKAGPVKKEQKDWGIAGNAKAGMRTVEFRMTDNMRFTPDKIEVKQGETVKLIIKNSGAVMHEFVLGTKKELEEHAALMLKFPNMEHDEPYMAHVKPGGKEEIAWTFTKPGTYMYGCLIPGHFEAGMKGTITVVAK